MNLGRLRQRIYSPPPLTTRALPRELAGWYSKAPLLSTAAGGPIPLARRGCCSRLAAEALGKAEIDERGLRRGVVTAARRENHAVGAYEELPGQTGRRGCHHWSQLLVRRSCRRGRMGCCCCSRRPQARTKRRAPAGPGGWIGGTGRRRPRLALRGLPVGGLPVAGALGSGHLWSQRALSVRRKTVASQVVRVEAGVA